MDEKKFNLLDDLKERKEKLEKLRQTIAKISAEIRAEREKIIESRRVEEKTAEKE